MRWSFVEQTLPSVFVTSVPVLDAKSSHFKGWCKRAVTLRPSLLCVAMAIPQTLDRVMIFYWWRAVNADSLCSLTLKKLTFYSWLGVLGRCGRCQYNDDQLSALINSPPYLTSTLSSSSKKMIGALTTTHTNLPDFDLRTGELIWHESPKV